MENDFPSIPFPLCIIPEGTTNIISHTIQGNTDPCTPLLHLIFSKKIFLL
jgi:diacylglycerol kinase family enzyme